MIPSFTEQAGEGPGISGCETCRPCLCPQIVLGPVGHRWAGGYQAEESQQVARWPVPCPGGPYGREVLGQRSQGSRTRKRGSGLHKPLTQTCTIGSQTYTFACAIVRMHGRMHVRTHACMGRCMHARARDTTSPMHARKGKNPPGKWMPRLWPVPLVWRPLFGQSRSRMGKVSSRNEGV